MLFRSRLAAASSPLPRASSPPTHIAAATTHRHLDDSTGAGARGGRVLRYLPPPLRSPWCLLLHTPLALSKRGAARRLASREWSPPRRLRIRPPPPSLFLRRVDRCHGEDADGRQGRGLQFKARASGTEPAPTFRCELQLPKGEHVSSMAVIAKLPRVGVAYKHESKQSDRGGYTSHDVVFFSFAGTAHISNSNYSFIYCCSHVASFVSFKANAIFCQEHCHSGCCHHVDSGLICFLLCY